MTARRACGVALPSAAASKTGAEPHLRVPVGRGLRLAQQRETASEPLLALRRQQCLGTVPIFGRCLFVDTVFPPNRQGS
ncbi:hypothetical protein, partial [Xanthomonas translucens]